MIQYKPRMPTKSILCKWIRIPIFVPPVLIVMNLYVILMQPKCSVDNADNPYIRDRRSILSLADGASDGVNDDEIERQSIINSGRLDHIKNMCAKYTTDENFRHMKMSGYALTTPDKSLIYCDVPKVGCTHWKRVFRYITHDYEGTVNNPEEIPRIYTHFGPWNHTNIVQLSNETHLNELNGVGFRFMISRDPYERLWSGYLDKLFLPDFWWWLGTKIVTEVRPKSEELAKKCGHDVSFSEFLEFTANHIKLGKHVDMHFEPMHSRCNPCKMNFHVIGKMETFDSDSKLIMNRAMHTLRTKRTVVVDRALEEIKMLTTYNFDIQTRLTTLGSNEDCYDQVVIAYRLWKAFQYNGYIGDEVEFPQEELDSMQNRDLIKEALLNKLIALRKRTPKNVLKQWKQQRRKYLEKAYRNIPKDILEGIRDGYLKDFELFQYGSAPEYIFRH